MATTITAGNATTGAAVSSDNTGILELKTGTGAGTTALTLNASQNATLAGTLGVGAVTSTGLVTGATGALYPIVSGTAQASTSGTSIDFTGIPSWVKRVTVMFNELSTNGTSTILIQIGDSGGVETTSYNATAMNGPNVGGNATTGFPINNTSGAAGLYSGSAVISLVSPNIWVFSSMMRSSGFVYLAAGQKSISDTLDRVRITTVNGTDTFDAGTINILYE